jgi:hypothetical protein
MKRLFLAFGLALLALVPARAKNEPRPWPSLEGLTGVRVAIDSLAPEVVERGITEDVLFAEVQLQLRQAHIDILPEGAKKPAPGDPLLRLVVVAAVHPTFDQCSFSVRLDLEQAVRLERQPKGTALRAVTWSLGGIGEGGSKWRQILREEVAYYTARFVEAYLAANPPQAG